MPLPTSGQISFADLNTDRGFGATTEIDLRSTAQYYGLVAPDSMNEFYNVIRYDVYEGFTNSGLTYYFVPFTAINPYESQFGDDCFTKLTQPPGLIYGDIVTTYPSAQYLPNAGSACGSGGESPL